MSNCGMLEDHNNNTRRHSVTFKLHKDSSHNLRSLSSALAVAKESHFNQRYKEYKERVKEVNQAKEMLLNGRDQMSFEVKKRLVSHIKHKMAIIGLIEEELRMDSLFR